MYDGDYNEIDKEDYQYFHGKARFLFNKFLNELRILLSSGNVVLPIGGIYTKQFYYDQIYRQMKGLIEGMFNEICPYFHRFPPSIYENYVCKFRTYIKNLSNLVTSDIWE
ncbi:hypothetical protein NBO_494g0001 [Nosema bombycis CQ1]|uniref:Uncharacterized protein n=1 Tax=Nosema bombycis (strain CQ1 / CVCC 102059) TaxID=578461 RepID=R0MDS2_NOSB1|nr:hypothetical protein NBO_494g0001 [Nosema bombycis CQ1]|eukprot:EOB12230.1 hypothetical protein NBO_494g0001 [Nosema bombycis CQ1]